MKRSESKGPGKGYSRRFAMNKRSIGAKDSNFTMAMTGAPKGVIQ